MGRFPRQLQALNDEFTDRFPGQRRAGGCVSHGVWLVETTHSEQDSSQGAPSQVHGCWGTPKDRAGISAHFLLMARGQMAGAVWTKSL